MNYGTYPLISFTSLTLTRLCVTSDTEDKTAHDTRCLYKTWKIFTMQKSYNFAEAEDEVLCQTDLESHCNTSFFLPYEFDSWAQKASGSGQKREKSSTSRFAMCQLTARACIDLNSRRMIGRSHHLSSSLSASKTYHQRDRNEVLKEYKSKKEESQNNYIYIYICGLKIRFDLSFMLWTHLWWEILVPWWETNKAFHPCVWFKWFSRVLRA